MSDERVERAIPVSLLGRWLLLLGGCVLLGGLPGAAVAVVVAAVRLARLPDRVLGAIGVSALLVVPAVVVAGGLPTSGTVSPSFVSDTLVPHQLTFFGLAIASIWAILDTAAHLRPVPERAGDDGGEGAGREGLAEADAATEADVADRRLATGPLLGRWIGPVVVVVAATGAVAASLAVVLG